jgi:hypothetical protein
MDTVSPANSSTASERLRLNFDKYCVSGVSADVVDADAPRPWWCRVDAGAYRVASVRREMCSISGAALRARRLPRMAKRQSKPAPAAAPINTAPAPPAARRAPGRSPGPPARSARRRQPHLRARSSSAFGHAIGRVDGSRTPAALNRTVVTGRSAEYSGGRPAAATSPWPDRRNRPSTADRWSSNTAGRSSWGRRRPPDLRMRCGLTPAEARTAAMRRASPARLAVSFGRPAPRALAWYSAISAGADRANKLRGLRSIRV